MSSLSIHVIYVALVGSGIQVTVCACMCLSRGTQNLFVVIDQVSFLFVTALFQIIRTASSGGMA
jgi:hypothetical protein